MSDPAGQDGHALLVVDGASAMRIDREGTELPLTPEHGAGVLPVDAVLVRALPKLRQQAGGLITKLPSILRTAPIYAEAASMDDKARTALAAFMTPFDRTIGDSNNTLAPAHPLKPPGNDITAAVFADLDHNGPVLERAIAKGRYNDLRAVLGPRLRRAAARSANRRPLALCAGASSALQAIAGDTFACEAVSPQAKPLVGARADALLMPGSVASDPDHRDQILADCAPALSRSASLIAVFGAAVGEHADKAALCNGTILSDLLAAAARTVGADVGASRVDTIAHKPLDAIPQTFVISAQVMR